MKKRILSLCMAVLALISLLVFPIAAADKPTVSGVDAVYVINLEYGETVFSYNENKHLYPASTAKLVTALVAEQVFEGDFEKSIEFTKDMKDASSGRCFGFSVGEKVTYGALLHALLVGGYNDAAVALAIASKGTVRDFADSMNEYARALGALDTHYTNPTGLHDPAMVTTAKDTARIAIALMQNEELFNITKKPKYVMPATSVREQKTIYSRNSLISAILEEGYFYSYASGIHAGSTDEGGDCAVTSGSLDGLTYVTVVLGGRGDGDTNQAFITAKNVLRYSLLGFSEKTLKSQKYQFITLPVQYSATVTETAVYPKENMTALVPSDFDVSSDVVFSYTLTTEKLSAPVQNGITVGQIFAKDKNGKLLAKTELIVTENIESHGFLVFMARLKGFVLSPLFFILILLTAALIFWSVYYDRRRHGNRRKVRRRYDKFK
jgi:D-alanyl-D-alanine carboxypeptidase